MRSENWKNTVAISRAANTARTIATKDFAMNSICTVRESKVGARTAVIRKVCN